MFVYVCMYMCVVPQLLSAKAVVYLLNASSRDYLRLLSTDNKDHDGDDDDGSGEEKKNHHPKDHNIAASRHRVSSNKKLEAVRLAQAFISLHTYIYS